MMQEKHKDVYLAVLSLVLVLLAGSISLLGFNLEQGQLFGIGALSLGIFAVLFVPRPRQPQVHQYQPVRWTQHLLKWVSAPQIESVILLWFGISLLAQPQYSSAYELSDSHLLTQVLGWVFVMLAWRMAVQLPSPVAYTVMTSYRLLYTLVVLFNVITTDGPLIIIGAYLGGILHGMLAMIVQWELRQIARQMASLRQQLHCLQQDL